jgi:uncharacterized membrane protein
MVLYSIVPWIGVMAAGYGFGHLITRDPARRKQVCLRLGMAAVGAFLLLRATEVYGDRPWVPAPGEEPWAPYWIMFLATTKYPASLQFLLMTLGPALLAMAALDAASDRVSRWLTVFGRVPMFFYLLHIPLIHALALVVSGIRLGEVSPWLFANHPVGPPPPPDGYAWSLGLLYLIWAIAVVLLYFPCRWYAELKARRQDWWLKYL